MTVWSWGPQPSDLEGTPTLARTRRIPPPVAALCATAAGGLALFVLPLCGIHLRQMNGLGLLSVLSARSLTGVVLLTLSFVLALGLRDAHPVVLAAMLVGIVICLDGVTVLAEPEPRFATAYQIAGFTEYVSRTGHVAPGIAAYFSWPGFFTLVSFMEGVAGIHDLVPVLRIWPVAIDLACLPPLFLILRTFRLTWRAKWFAALLFCVANWVGQDYFSPQAFNYLLYLLFIAILMTWFGHASQAPARAEPEQARPARRWTMMGRRRTLEPGELPSAQISQGQRVLLLATLVAIFAVSVVSHQLTPFFMVGACGALVLVRRCTLAGLPVLLGVILLGWISFAAVAYWSGHQSVVFGGIGHLGVNVSTSVAGRMTGSTPQHLRVLYVRGGLAAVVLALAVFGALRRRRRGVDDRAALVLMCVPFLAVGLQSYGGEIGLRVYLFALPGACVLAACLFFPAPEEAGSPWEVLPTVAVLAAVLAVAFFVARYGNEAYEQVPRGELTAMNYVYAHDSQGARLVWLSPAPAIDNTPQMPWQYRDIEKVDFIAAQAPHSPANVAGIVSTLRDLGPGTYLITTRTEETYLEQAASYPPGWGDRFRVGLAAAPRVRVAFANHDAAIFTLQWPPGTTPKPPAINAAGPALRTTAWTVADLAVFDLLVAVLLAREFTRVWRVGPRPPRALTVASVPLLALLLAVVIERFVTLS